MKLTTVVNKYTDAYDVYIGRGSKWGNPFHLQFEGNRATVIEKYRAYLICRRLLYWQRYQNLKVRC